MCVTQLTQARATGSFGTLLDLVTSGRILILSGAGLSTESGIPDYRGPTGLARRAQPMTYQVFTGNAAARRRCWARSYLGWRHIARAAPNGGHRAVAELSRRGLLTGIITQNVDGLHEAAGSQRLTELHGNIWKVRCTQCGTRSVNRDIPMRLLPYCECGGLLRPHIVWFGEALDPSDLERSQEALNACDVLLIIGTSGVVYPAASFAAMARAAGAFIAEVNLDATPNSSVVDVAIQGRAKDIVPELL